MAQIPCGSSLPPVFLLKTQREIDAVGNIHIHSSPRVSFSSTPHPPLSGPPPLAYEETSAYPVMSRNSITTECADFQSVGKPVLGRRGGRIVLWRYWTVKAAPMNVMKLMVVARAGWINQQQEDVIA